MSHKTINSILLWNISCILCPAYQFLSVIVTVQKQLVLFPNKPLFIKNRISFKQKCSVLKAILGKCKRLEARGYQGTGQCRACTGAQRKPRRLTWRQMATLTLQPNVVLTERAGRPRSLNSLEKDCVSAILGRSSATTMHVRTHDRFTPFICGRSVHATPASARKGQTARSPAPWVPCLRAPTPVLRCYTPAPGPGDHEASEIPWYAQSQGRTHPSSPPRSEGPVRGAPQVCVGVELTARGRAPREGFLFPAPSSHRNCPWGLSRPARTHSECRRLRTQAPGTHLHHRVGAEGDARLVLADGPQPQGHVGLQLRRGHQHRLVSRVDAVTATGRGQHYTSPLKDLPFQAESAPPALVKSGFWWKMWDAGPPTSIQGPGVLVRDPLWAGLGSIHEDGSLLPCPGWNW